MKFIKNHFHVPRQNVSLHHVSNKMTYMRERRFGDIDIITNAHDERSKILCSPVFVLPEDINNFLAFYAIHYYGDKKHPPLFAISVYEELFRESSKNDDENDVVMMDCSDVLASPIPRARKKRAFIADDITSREAKRSKITNADNEMAEIIKCSQELMSGTTKESPGLVPQKFNVSALQMPVKRRVHKPDPAASADAQQQLALPALPASDDALITPQEQFQEQLCALEDAFHLNRFSLDYGFMQEDMEIQITEIQEISSTPLGTTQKTLAIEASPTTNQNAEIPTSPALESTQSTSLDANPIIEDPESPLKKQRSSTFSTGEDPPLSPLKQRSASQEKLSINALDDHSDDEGET